METTKVAFKIDWLHATTTYLFHWKKKRNSLNQFNIINMMVSQIHTVRKSVFKAQPHTSCISCRFIWFFHYDVKCWILHIYNSVVHIIYIQHTYLSYNCIPNVRKSKRHFRQKVVIHIFVSFSSNTSNKLTLNKKSILYEAFY